MIMIMNCLFWHLAWKIILYQFSNDKFQNKADEWLPKVVIPLTYDRASKMKVAVFYTKFNQPTGSREGNLISLMTYFVEWKIETSK